MNIIKYDQDYSEYLHDESRRSGEADYICFPQNEADISKAVKYAQNNNLTITMQGSRTGITAGAVPKDGLIINFEKMNKVTAIREENGYYFLTCQPGIKLNELRSLLAERSFDTTGWSQESLQTYRKFKLEKRWMYPPDPTETSASLGGMVACNASGARSYKYGATRNWITDIKIIPQQNQRLQLSENFINRIDPSLKNAAGYYLQKDRRKFDHFIGSEGTLGIISELEIKLIPEPAHYIAVMQFFKKESLAYDFCSSMRKEKTTVAMEYFSASALNLLRENKQLWQQLPDMQDDWKCAVYLEFCGDDEDELEDMAITASELAEKLESNESDSWFIDNRAGIEDLKIFRHAVPEAINLKLDEIKKQFKDIAKISTDLAVPEGSLSELVELYDQAAEEGFEIVIFGHIGNNHLHTNIIPKSMEEYKKGQDIAENWAKKAVELGGTVSGEHGIGKSKKHLLKLMYSQEELKKMQILKKHYDPQNIFNPGNLF